eukprot:jgi/Picsp_1/6543/NSC_03886-R1_hypothetical protein CHLNCDRAFT_144503 [Chlorella variabilis]
MILLSVLSYCLRPRHHVYRKFTSFSTKASDWCCHANEVLKGYESSDDEKKILKGKRYRFLLESVQNRQMLLASYNIGIPIDVREKEMNRRAAQLVGLRLPQDV